MNKRYPRPLTHDLMDATITKLNAKVIRAQVDALDSDVYIGTLVLKRGNEILRLDARPSDAMAMAIGNAVPIYVAADVLKQAGIAVDKLDNDKPSHVDPISL
jgi:bifunctional DNase/RNase